MEKIERGNGMRKKYVEVANAHIDWLNKRARRAAELEKRVQELEKENQRLKEHIGRSIT